MKSYILAELTIHNFGPFKGTHRLVDIDLKTLIGVIGTYEGVKGKSNRSGKCFDPRTEIRMYDGSIESISCIDDGDIVMGPDSKPRVVTGTTTGTEEMFLVESKDGSISFRCNRSHILSLKLSSGINIGSKTYEKDDVVNISIEDYLTLPDWKTNVMNLYRSGQIEYEEKNLYSPYMYGLWLGDGSKTEPKITNGDIEIKKAIENFCISEDIELKTKEYSGKTKTYWDFKLTGKPIGFQGKEGSTSSFANFLKSNHMYDFKRILPDYLVTSAYSRLQLLAGLIDSDGYLAKDGKYYEIIVKDDCLAEGIVELCRSLGLATSNKEKMSNIGEKVYGPYNRINIFGDISKIPCKVGRKKTEFTTTKKDVLRKGFAVKSLGENEYCGFSVDKDHLFLLADYTVVHNSMFLEVFTYLLTGKSRADTEVELIHDDEDVMFVEGLFVNEHDGEDYKRVKRGRDSKNKGLLEVDWIEKSKDAKQAIIDTFGVHPDDFEITAFFKQSDIEGFMKKKPAEQSEDMMKWMDNGHWPLKAERVKKDIKTFRDRLKDVESTKRALESSLESSDALQIQIGQKNLEADALDKQLRNTEGGLDELLKSKKDAEEKLGETNAIKKLILSKIQEANKNEREITRIKTNVKNYSIKLNRIQAEVEDDFKDFKNGRAEIVSLSEELGLLDSSISHLKGLIRGISESKGVCPVLGSQCDAISSTGSIKDYQAQHDAILKDYNEAKKELKDTKRLVQLCDELDQYNKKLDEANNDLSKLGAIDLTEVNKELVRLDSEVTKKKEFLSLVQGSINNVNDVADAHSYKIKELDSDIKVLKHRLSVYDETLEKITEKDETASKLRLVIADLSDIAIMFSKYGIPADEIDNSLGTIQDKVNMLLKLSGLDLSMHFSPDKEISGREPVCICGHHFVKGFRGAECPDCGMVRQNKRKTEMTIKIIEDGKERKFKMDSGGGKTLIAFAVRIAINLIKREQGKMNLNMLFLDEVDAPFDDFHLDKLITIITTTLVKSFGYRQIILISHNAKIRDSIDDIIKVVRYSDNTSKVSFDN